MRYLMLVLMLVMLGGCADSHTTGQEKDLDIRTTINITQMEGNKGSVTITPGIDYASAAGDTTQDTANTAETPTDVDLNLKDVNNPVSTMTEVLERKADTKIIKRADEIQDEIVEDNDNSDIVRLEDFKPENNRMFRWMEKTGADYPKGLTFVFPECDYTFIVEDPSQDVNAESNRPKDQGVWFSAPKRDDGSCHMPGCTASVFAPEKCSVTYALMGEVE